MSSTLGLRVLPTTGSFIAPVAGYFVFLSCRVVYHRFKDTYYLGDNSSGAKTTTTPDPASSDDEEKKDKPPSLGDNQLYLSTRSHQQFVENVPLALIVATVAELNGANPKYLFRALAVFFGSKILHTELGLQLKGMGLGRPIGFYGSMGSLGFMAGYCAVLVNGQQA